MVDHIYLIPLLPLLASAVILLWGPRLPGKGSALGIASLVWGFAHSSILLWQGVHGSFSLPYEFAYSWFPFDFYEMEIGFWVDGFTLTMLFMVSLVCLLIQIYSLGYMREDPRFSRYYAFITLFTAAMLGLVVANNLLMFFIAWELMGVCSYFLIGFWFEKPSAAYAGRKAFMTTKLGDIGFFLGILMLFWTVGTLRFSQVANHVESGFLTPESATVIALLLFCGVVGKSAQVPLFIWLPDAMEGPTPVSALIHAATMVAAGVCLIGRMFMVFHLSPAAMEVVAWAGCLTAFLAATMALVAYDIKRVLAFSTISQLGYMVMALGCGGYTAGLFHLITHAFFKALLFLAAGSVIHSVHTNDMREMGGLSRKMPITFITTFVACLAISGIPPFAGYFSKDEVILATLGNRPIAILAVITAALTAFYMFRLFFLTFLTNPRDLGRFARAHESPKSMTIPLLVLAALSAFSG
ncbi:MAG: NADH-quinone oxidoreductase subunit L, partial [Elusimicrobia bacterium]|nr:NADH-quinone oxidoreductase subunit L [Elusimicrobiota bacterium]